MVFVCNLSVTWKRVKNTGGVGGGVFLTKKKDRMGVGSAKNRLHGEKIRFRPQK